MAVMHFEVPRHTTPSGRIINTACRAYFTAEARTIYRADVTCQPCKRSGVFRSGTRSVTGRKDKQPRDRAGYKKAWAEGGARRAALEAKQRQCPCGHGAHRHLEAGGCLEGDCECDRTLGELCGR